MSVSCLHLSPEYVDPGIACQFFFLFWDLIHFWPSKSHSQLWCVPRTWIRNFRVLACITKLQSFSSFEQVYRTFFSYPNNWSKSNELTSEKCRIHGVTILSLCGEFLLLLQHFRCLSKSKIFNFFSAVFKSLVPVRNGCLW